MAMASTGWIVFDCPDPYALCRFYADLLGGQADDGRSDENWVELTTDGGWKLAFQRVPDHVPPRWPSPEHSQQLHLDLYVEDQDAAQRQVVALGAKELDTDDQGGKRDFRVYADPAGHPFCFCRAHKD